MRRIAGAAALLAAWLVGMPLAASAAPQAQATLSAGTVEAGAGVTLVVAVSDPGGPTGDPQFSLPRGLTLLGSEQGQSYSWVNGRSSSRIEYRYAISTDVVGHYTVGPIRVKMGRQVYECPALSLTVTAAAALPGGAAVARTAAGAALEVSVSPQHPYVGQLVQLALKLVQTRDLSQSGPNSTPSTTGFWAEGYGDPVEYRVNTGHGPGVVTERRARLYPLAPGPVTIGSAAIVVSLSSSDPFATEPGRPFEIRSQPVKLDVRPLPPGAPAGFANAVGAFRWSWSLDRGHTTKDQALTLQLDVRGTGNLPLLRTPTLAPPDFEVYASTVDDSFPPAGEAQAGRRRFQWTLMPRRTGVLHLAPPALAWFDPATGAYHSAELPALEVEVLAAGPGSGTDRDASAFPPVFGRDPARPGARPAWPWLFALAGALAAFAVRTWRAANAPDPDGPERARMRELLRAVGLAHGPDFWIAADEAVRWVERRGGQVLRLREDIAAARYSGRPLPEDDVRRRLVERVGETLPATASRLPRQLVAAGCALLALAALALGAGVHGPDALAARAREADALARQGRVADAVSAWEGIWRESPGDPALAARLAWAALKEERVGTATVWAMRGQQGEPRSAALGWTAARLREAGALTGVPGQGLPLRSLEWAALAFALMLGAVLEWPRRWSAIALALLAIAAAAAVPVRHTLAAHEPVAVVGRAVTLEGGDVDLVPGQVVRVTGRDGAGRVRVRAGRDLAGVLPEEALLHVGGTGW